MKIHPVCPSLAGRSNLVLRIVSSLVLAPLAIAAAYFGGIAFIAFWAIAALAVLWEWDTLVCAEDRNPVLATGAVALAGSALLLTFGRPGVAVAIIVLGFFGVAALASRARRVWCASGLVYAAVTLDRAGAAAARREPGIRRDPVSVRDRLADRHHGLFRRARGRRTEADAARQSEQDLVGRDRRHRGRHCGWRRCGMAIRHRRTWHAVAAVAFVLSVVSQAGDLAESAIKRQFNAKDASQLIPGHGGLMDRLDGFVAAAAAGALDRNGARRIRCPRARPHGMVRRCRWLIRNFAPNERGPRASAPSRCWARPARSAPARSICSSAATASTASRP